MRSRQLGLVVALTAGLWLAGPGAADAALKVATLSVKGMACQA